MSEEKTPTAIEFLACKRCSKNYEKARFFFDDYRERLCRNCIEGNEPDESRDFYMLSDTDIQVKVRQEEASKEAERRVDVLEIALDKKKKRVKEIDPGIDECLLKSDDLKAQTALKRYGRKRK